MLARESDRPSVGCNIEPAGCLYAGRAWRAIVVPMTAVDRARLRPALPQPGAWRRRVGDLALGASPLVVGGLSSVFTVDGLRVWYRTIRRPDWNPPDEVFGPVWTALYVAMGIALVQVVRSDRDRIARQAGLGLFVVQLVLNFGWSWIFFVNHDLSGALIEVIALWLAIAATIVAVGRVRTSAAVLLVPYLAWVTFAAALTAAIWRLNR
jgi:tryptophan-rich sensory protein